MKLSPGLHRGIPSADYLSIDAIGSGRLKDLAISPLHYRYMLDQKPEDTTATLIGTALHRAVLEPDLFWSDYAMEPDPHEVAPNNSKPRATNLYRDAVKALEESGRIVLRKEHWDAVTGMAASIMANPHATKILDRCPDRELSMIWDRNGRACRARADIWGDGVLADIKTTRQLREFSPWVLTRMGYYRQAAHERAGAKVLGNKVKHFFFIAVDNAAPYDCGVFVVDEGAMAYGDVEIDSLLALLDECERTNTWSGMFPEIQHAMLAEPSIKEEMEVAVDG